MKWGLCFNLNCCINLPHSKSEVILQLESGFCCCAAQSRLSLKDDTTGMTFSVAQNRQEAFITWRSLSLGSFWCVLDCESEQNKVGLKWDVTIDFSRRLLTLKKGPAGVLSTMFPVPWNSMLLKTRSRHSKVCVV